MAMMEMEEEGFERSASSAGRTFLTFLVGATAGAVTALLLAPYSGRESREKIRDVAKSARERAGRIPSAMREAGTAAKGAFGQSYEEGAEHHS